MQSAEHLIFAGRKAASCQILLSLFAALWIVNNKCLNSGNDVEVVFKGKDMIRWCLHSG